MNLIAPEVIGNMSCKISSFLPTSVLTESGLKGLISAANGTPDDFAKVANIKLKGKSFPNSVFFCTFTISKYKTDMNNNDVIRRVRYTFDLKDDKMMKLFLSGGKEITRAELSAWLKRDDDPEVVAIYDVDLAAFLNGFIIAKRGKKDDTTPVAEKRLNNNGILRKLKIALNLKTEDMVEIMKLAGIRVSAHEITALFRRPDQNQYRVCKDQFLRNFLFGMQKKYRPEPE